MHARVLAVALLAAAAPAAAQQVVLSNLPGQPSGFGSSLGVGIDGIDRTKAVGLIVGDTPEIFHGLTAIIGNGEVPSVLSGGVYADNGGNPGALLGPFVPVAVPQNAPSTPTFITTAGTLVLEANTTYWFVLDGPGVQQSLRWDDLISGAAPVPAPGFGFAGYRFSGNGGSTWSNSGVFNGVSVTVRGGCNPADLDGNGELNFDDIDLFVESFLAGCPG